MRAVTEGPPRDVVKSLDPQKNFFYAGKQRKIRAQTKIFTRCDGNFSVLRRKFPGIAGRAPQWGLPRELIKPAIIKATIIVAEGAGAGVSQAHFNDAVSFRRAGTAQRQGKVTQLPNAGASSGRGAAGLIKTKADLVSVTRPSDRVGSVGIGVRMVIIPEPINSPVLEFEKIGIT